jgi:hypothetical protein
MKRMIAFESRIEWDYIFLLDYEQAVEWFEEQPLTIPYHYDGKELYYTPDFHAVRLGQHWLIECKADKFVDSEENRRKFFAAAAWCEERAWVFQVVTGQEIRAGHCLENVKFLTKFARHSINPALKSHIDLKLLATRHPLTVADLAQEVRPGNPDEAIPAIYHLAFHHQVVIPLDSQPISTASPVTLPAPERRLA